MLLRNLLQRASDHRQRRPHTVRGPKGLVSIWPQNEASQQRPQLAGVRDMVYLLSRSKKYSGFKKVCCCHSSFHSEHGRVSLTKLARCLGTAGCHSVLQTQELKKPGDKLIDGTTLGSTKCAGRTDSVFYTSPTIKYAGLKFYAEPQPFYTWVVGQVTLFCSLSLFLGHSFRIAYIFCGFVTAHGSFDGPAVPPGAELD
eukprot:COSAG06_NODE_4497_length_4202_cov_90.716549_7_plen_199_part_00